MKALTIIQPYAHLIAEGLKVVENRKWATPYRGPLLIHAGKNRSWLESGERERYPHMAFGAIVALATLVGCVPLEKLPERYRGHRYAEGPFCWLLRDVRRLVEPVPCTGAQGLWEPDRTTLAAVRSQLEVMG